MLLKSRLSELFSAYFSYIKEEENDVEYTFYSSVNDIIYNVTFGINDYSFYLDDFPTLLQDNYSLSFRSKKFSAKRTLTDTLVFATLYNIILDFLATTGKETVLLYHCDVTDNRQIYRNKLFANWEKAASETTLFKHSIETVIYKPSASFKTSYFFGFITFTDNPNLEKIKQEFDSFSYQIIQPKAD